MPSRSSTRRLPALLASLAVVIALLQAVPAAPALGNVACPTVRVPVSDGAELGGCLFLPEGEGPWPTIVVVTPYGNAGELGYQPYLEQGYAHLNVSVRGTGESEGSWCVFCEREAKDAAEAVEWAAVQPWSDGNIGMYGGSYPGITALHAAARQPTGLKAIVPAVVISDAYRDAVWHNGIFNHVFMHQYTIFPSVLGATATMDATTPRALYERRYTRLPGPESRLEQFDNGDYRERSLYTKFDQITVPTLLIGGWFDGLNNGTVHNYMGIASRHKRMIMGPGTHKDPLAPGGPFNPLTEYGGIDGPPLPEDPILAWFDRFLKDQPNGIEKGPGVVYFDLGESTWETADQWPPGEAKRAKRGYPLRTFHLSAEPADSGPSINDGTLTATPPSGDAQAAETYLYDPTAGAAESLSKYNTVGLTPHVRVDQRADHAKQLTWSTAPQKQPLRIAGPLELDFWATTTAPDTDWIVKVSDVAPDGQASLLTSGYLRASHREVDRSQSRPAEPWIANLRALPVTAGEATRYRVPIWHIAQTIKPGHRLRIQLASADTPTHEPLPYPAVNTVLHDAEHPSVLRVATR